MQITADGEPLLAGCGFGFIGSQFGPDTIENVTSCLPESADGIMRTFSGSAEPYLHHQLFLLPDVLDPGVIYFGGEVGYADFDFATVSMPCDAHRDLFTHFRFPGTSYVTGAEGKLVNASMGKFEDNEFSYSNDVGTMKIASAVGQMEWGEMIGPEWTLRVVLTGRTRPMSLHFVDHPTVRNVEFSFGRLAKGEKAYVTGYIEVYPTIDYPDELPSNWSFEAESDFYHQVGKREFDGWSAATGQLRNAFMAFGPYTMAIPSGKRRAEFRLKLVDSTSSSQTSIVDLDIYDAYSGKRLAVRSLRKADFGGSTEYKNFPLVFDCPRGALLEFRVMYRGGRYVKLDRVDVE